MPTIKVLAHKGSTAAFEVTANTRPDAEEAIAAKLRSGEDIVWTDDPAGISVAVIWDNVPWRPRRRFPPTNAQSRPLQSENKSEAPTNGEGEQ
jgi:hypothetical protein